MDISRYQTESLNFTGQQKDQESCGGSMLFLGERERPLCQQKGQKASKWDLSPFSTNNLGGFQSSAKLQKWYQCSGTSILLREQV